MAEPPNGSRTRSRRRVQSERASAIIATGFTVGCIDSASSRPSPKPAKPRQDQTLLRLRPRMPSSTVLNCCPARARKRSTSSCCER